MAIETTIGGDGTFYIGEHKRLKFGPLTKPSNWVDAVDGAYVTPDLSAKTIHLVVRRKDNTADPALIDREVDGFIGIYNADVTLNTQQAYFDLDDDESNLFRIYSDGSAYRWSLKIMDFPETILGAGDWKPQQATAR